MQTEGINESDHKGTQGEKDKKLEQKCGYLMRSPTQTDRPKASPWASLGPPEDLRLGGGLARVTRRQQVHQPARRRTLRTLLARDRADDTEPAQGRPQSRVEVAWGRARGLAGTAGWAAGE